MILEYRVLGVNIPLDVYFIAEPIMGSDGRVVAMEVLTRFSLHGSVKVVMFPPEFIIRRASKKFKQQLFEFQLNEINKHSDFFLENNIICTVNADRDISRIICGSSYIKFQLISLPFVRIEISETFSIMNDGCTDPLLYELGLNFGLWLDDFGSGHANLSALQSGLFETVKIDKTFYWEHAGKSLWAVLIREIHRYTPSVVVEGVENRTQVRQLMHFVEGMQGHVFPAALLDNPEVVLAMDRDIFSCGPDSPSEISESSDY